MLIYYLAIITLGRDENEEETKLFTKADFQAAKADEATNNSNNESNNVDEISNNAPIIIEALGGESNIVSVDAYKNKINDMLGFD